MERLSMNGLRNGWLARFTAALTLFFFSFVFYLAPTGQAIAQELGAEEQRQQQLDAVLENTPEKKLAHRLEKLKHKILAEIPEAQRQRQEDGGLLDDIIAFFSGGETLTGAELGALRQLRFDIEAARWDAAGDFNAVEQRLVERGLPPVAIERHRQAQAEFEGRYGALLAKLDALLEAPGEQTFTDLQGFIDQQQFKRPHTPLDPGQLPFGTPPAEVRAPFTEEADLQSHLGIDPYAGLPRFAALGVTPEMLAAAFAEPGGPTAVDLAETPDTRLTDALRAKAAELGHDPIAIYTWVHNNIRFVPSYGSIQGADLTLQTLRGNAIDTASLLIALLRASNIPARYAYGVIDVPADQAMNWVGGVTAPQAALNLLGQGGIPSVGRATGGVVKFVRLEHTWVEAFVDFEPSRGQKLHDLDSWVPLDASFKQYDLLPGYDLKDSVPFDAQALVDQVEAAATVNEAEGWVQHVPQQAVTDQLSQYQQRLEDYLASRNPDATVGEVLGMQTLRVIPPEPLAAGLPYDLVARQQHFSEVPDRLRHKFQYELQTTNGYGQPVGQVFHLIENTVDIAGRKLALSFRPATAEDQAILESYLPEPDPVTGEIDPGQLPSSLPGYLIHLTAEFSEDGQTTHSGAAGTLGGGLQETLGLYSPAKGWSTSRNAPVAGEYRAIGLDLQGASPAQARTLQQRLEATQAIIQSEDAAQLATLTRHELVGDLMQGTILSYFALNDVQDEIARRSAEMVGYRQPSYGLFATALEPQYWFGVPRTVRFAGLGMDVDLASHQSVQRNNDHAAWIGYNRGLGARYSAMEHLVPEQLFSTDSAPAEGISAVKALALASAAGQRIYTITADTLYTALNQLQLGADTEREIEQAVLAGKVVTTHQYQLDFHGWIGEGYIIEDPETGSGAYKIAGGGNGNFLEILSSFASEIFVLSLGVGLGALLLALGGILAATLIGTFIALAATIAYVQLMLFIADNMDVRINECVNILINYFLKFVAVFIVGVRAIASFVGATISALVHRLLVSDDIDRLCL